MREREGGGGKFESLGKKPPPAPPVERTLTGVPLYVPYKGFSFYSAFPLTYVSRVSTCRVK